jgi:hypothetical protein
MMNSWVGFSKSERNDLEILDGFACWKLRGQEGSDIGVSNNAQQHIPSDVIRRGIF